MKQPFETVAMIGLGYIGLPTAAVLASRGVRVIGVDINQHAVDTINRGEIHIVEPDLDAVVRGVVKGGFLRATTRPQAADAFIIAVPTPFKGDHEPDLVHVEAAAKSIAPFLRPGNLVILESTSPVGTTEMLAAWLAAARTDLSFPQQAGEKADVQVAYCPERVLPGKILTEIVENDRVIGGLTPRCAERAADLYRVFVKGACHITDVRTAEMCKLTENSFRDVNIAFANELSMICERLKINVWQLIRLANRHPRVNVLQPGPGVGGHCIAVDPWFIVHSAPEQAVLIRSAREVNDGKPEFVIKSIRDAIARFEGPPTIACLGLTFKANLDDIRESPALYVASRVKDLGIKELLVVEPYVESLPDCLSGPTVRQVPLESALELAEILVILVDHREFQVLRQTKIRAGVVTIDTRGLLEARQAAG